MTERVEVTSEAATAKVAVEAFAATSTEAGTVAAVLFVDRYTVMPPAGAGALRFTEQAKAPFPEMVAVEQLTELRTTDATPVPEMWTYSVPFIEELLATVNSPFEAPAVNGSNCTPIVAV